jgi:uncharacterized protein (DUF1800 family)
MRLKNSGLPVRLHFIVTMGAAWLVFACAGPALPLADGPGAGPSTADGWRAASRLGYGPSAATAPLAAAHPKAWALQQIDAAHAASRKAPVLAADASAFNAPIDSIARDFHIEREGQRLARAAQADAPQGAVAATLPPAPPNIQAFSRDMQQGALAWRLKACSDPDMENPLLARMTEFWFNHLNVYTGKGTVRPFAGHYAATAIRSHAIGKFEDLLLASARHPAMLFYLDQVQSNARGLNENYARELLELHTLGVNSGYTQTDVRELARILTGWSVGLAQGEGFRFNERLHDRGTKVLLGRTFSNGGEQEGEDALRMLARHPATAQRIARRLATTFVSDAPPPALIDRLASSFSRSGGDIRQMLRTMVDAPEFWATTNTLFKTPLDFACSALAANGGVRDRRDVQLALGFLVQAGQPMHGWQTPDGYSTSSAAWLAPEALTRRADFAIALAARVPEPPWLLPFLTPATRERVAREPPSQRTGLMLASPDFMRK